MPPVCNNNLRLKYQDNRRVSRRYGVSISLVRYLARVDDYSQNEVVSFLILVQGKMKNEMNERYWMNSQAATFAIFLNNFINFLCLSFHWTLFINFF